MRKKIIGIILFMLLTTTLLPITVLAEDPENPEITDTIGDARMYLDIEKVWFYEDPGTPDMLYTAIKRITETLFVVKRSGEGRRPFT